MHVKRPAAYIFIKCWSDPITQICQLNFPEPKLGFHILFFLVFSSFFFSLMLKSEVVHQRNAVFFYTYCTYCGLNRFSVVLHKRIVKLFSNVLFRVNTLWGKRNGLWNCQWHCLISKTSACCRVFKAEPDKIHSTSYCSNILWRA